jgi:tRNA-modifying protein YgfZ
VVALVDIGSRIRAGENSISDGISKGGLPELKKRESLDDKEFPRLEDYDAARHGVAFYPVEEAGYLIISGPDRAAFLQRQTTNDVTALSTERLVNTVLTSPTARILDLLTLLPEPEAIGVITLPGQVETTEKFLRGRVFFMDKVSIEDRTAALDQVDLIGPHAGDVLSSLGFSDIPQGDEIRTAERGSTSWRVFRHIGLGFRLLAPSQASETLKSWFEQEGIPRLRPESYDILRIERGVPSAGRELTEEYTPLETGLESTVSDSKGCYTGQEVIARQITYDKVIRNLVGVRLSGQVEPGDRVWSENGGAAAGSITSTANSPNFGVIAMAILKRPFNEPGTQVLVGTKETGVRGTVQTLPFDLQEK